MLEAEGVTIGAVTGVQGISWTELTITGQSNHAGTTPMSMRHDAGYAAGRGRVVRAPARGRDGSAAGRDRRADRAAPEPRERRRGARRSRSTCATPTRSSSAPRSDGCSSSVTSSRNARVCRSSVARSRALPPSTSTNASSRWSRRSRGHGGSRRGGCRRGRVTTRRCSRVCPAGMVFVPSVRGISHNPAELTDDADLEAGANVLLHVLLRLATDER